MPFFFDWSAYSDPNGTFTLNDGSEDLDVTVSAGSNQFIANMAGNDVLKSYEQTGPVSTTIGFDQVVQGVSFEIFDVDQGTDIEGWQGIGSGGWDDAITITAFDEAGNEIQMVSFSFILTTKPKNMRRASPKDEIVKIGLNLSPTIKPEAPKNCKPIIIKPNFSKPNRLNSLFMWDDLK